MKKIAVISSSVRDGRLSHRVALFLDRFIPEKTGAQTDLIDLKEYGFPLFNERLAFMETPTADVLDYARRFNEADGIVIVSPVYNAGFPAALKNVIDLLGPEWVKKPVLVSSVTYGPVPGIATVEKLQVLLMKMGARVASNVYTVINVGSDYAEDGTAHDTALAEKFSLPAINELMWLVDKTKEGQE